MPSNLTEGRGSTASHPSRLGSPQYTKVRINSTIGTQGLVGRATLGYVQEQAFPQVPDELPRSMTTAS